LILQKQLMVWAGKDLGPVLALHYPIHFPNLMRSCLKALNRMYMQ
jgi:hypothetical protein